MKNKKMFFTTKWIAYTAMMTALVVATSYIPALPIAPFGNIYWCDCMIFTAAYLLDPLAAFISGGIGTMLYDLIYGNTVMMLPSLIIHGLQALAVSALLHYVLPKKPEKLWAVIASVAGALIVIAGYFVLRVAIQEKGISYAVYRIVANICQEVAGIVIAMLIVYVAKLKEQLNKNHLLPDFKAEVLKSKKAPDESASVSN